MPSGQTSTAANGLPLCTGDDILVASISFTPSASGVTAPSQRGVTRQTINTGGVATTLLANQSGALVVWDSSTATTITLPAPVVGLWFEFLVTTAGNGHKIITNAGTVFLLGAIHGIAIATTPSSTAGPFAFSFNGSTHVACTMNSTTTLGIAGTRYRVECVSATVWAISGVGIGSGNLATPAATS